MRKHRVKWARRFTSSRVAVQIVYDFIARLYHAKYLFHAVPCRISQCLTTARRHFAIFLSARGWSHRLMLMRNVQPDAKTSEWGPNFPWTARLIMCPWDTRSIIATSIAGYPFYAKWERTNGWPSGTGWPSALGRSLPDTPDTSRDHPRIHKASFAPFTI